MGEWWWLSSPKMEMDRHAQQTKIPTRVMQMCAFQANTRLVHEQNRV
jgi:hypothetical protein